VKRTKKNAGSVNPLAVNSFFTGIGGFDLAFERAGFSITFQCDKDNFCGSVLRRHWPNAPLHSDISVLLPKEVPAAGVWAAGFPCQDLSLARTPHGRTGLMGAQSGLFFKLLNLMEHHHPEVVLIENVAGLLNSHSGQDFKTLLIELTGLGYGVAWRVLNARYFGAPQSRPRIFICAWKNSPEKAVQALFEDVKAIQPVGERAGFVTACEPTPSGAVVPQVSFCISATSGRHTGLDWARSYVSYHRAVRRLTPVECERLQGLPDDWTVPSSDFKIPARGIDTERYHAAGNAVCVPVAEWVAKRIARVIAEGDELSSKKVTERRLKGLAEEFGDSMSRTFSISHNSLPAKWASGGIAFKDVLIDAPTSSAPVKPVRSKFSAIIQESHVESRYYLSPNAAQGIVRRVDKMGRTLFKPLDEAIRHLAENTPMTRRSIDRLVRVAA
jgi:DNA (cytosine-5)-methyltransferase 1